MDPRRFEVPAPDAGAATVPAAPGTPEVEAAPPRPRRLRRRILTALAVLGALVVVLAGTGIWYAWKTYKKIERVAVADVLTPETGPDVNYLIVGTDSRDGLAEDIENREVVVGGGVSGQRSDTLVLMRVGRDGNRMLPIPRDLYVPIVDTKGSERINTAIQGGPDRLIRTVQTSLSLPVHHYVQIDFAGFLELVDAVGGVTIDFDAPAFDDNSGLNIPTAGPHKLDKDMALAYVRSRTYTRIVDGRRIVDPTADLGRILRQQTFLRAVMSEVGSTRNPITLARIGDAIAANMTMDDALGFADSISLARKLAGLDPETVDLPVSPTRTRGGAEVLVLKQPAATAALDRFRS